MKFSLVHNDKSTKIDELFLFFFIMVWLICGILLVIYKPTVWLINQNISTVFGIICILVAVMFTPGLIYRLLTNNK